MLAAMMLAIPVGAAAQTFSIDTGPGGSSSLGSPAVFASGATACSPQPACAANFQFLAGQLNLPSAAAIDSIQIWAVGNAGSMDITIRPSTANGVPSLTTSLYTKRYAVAGQFPANWAQFSNYGAVLPAGTYWISLEPVNASGLNWTLPIGAANPLPSYAYYANGNLGYNKLPTSNTLGFRISGTYVPGDASGTATRTILSGSVLASRSRRGISSPVAPERPTQRAGFSRLRQAGHTRAGRSTTVSTAARIRRRAAAESVRRAALRRRARGTVSPTCRSRTPRART